MAKINNIRCFHLLNGLVLLGEVASSQNGEIVLKRGVQVMIQRQGKDVEMQFAPIGAPICHDVKSPPANLAIHTGAIMYAYDIDGEKDMGHKNMQKNYDQTFSSLILNTGITG